jgi:hypothetical protein
VATKFYFDFHYPLQLAQQILNMILGKKDPSNPTATVDPATREWFSQPRPALNEKQRLTLFTVSGTFNTPTQGPQAEMAALLDSSVWTIYPIKYPAILYPMQNSISAGTASLITAIKQTPGKFALSGTSQGGIVVSEVYNEIRYGSLAYRRFDLLGGVTFGNPMREQGHTFPGFPDPGGRGIAEDRLKDTEDLWWDFAAPDDLVPSSPSGAGGEWASAAFDFINNNWTGRDSIVNQILEFIGDPFGEMTGIINLLAGGSKDLADTIAGHNPHESYNIFRPFAPADNATCVELGARYLNSVGVANPPPNVLLPTTEVIQVNFKLPLSVSEISFEVLRQPCLTEVWYQDRSNNWRPVLDATRLPLRVNVSRSDSKSYYKYLSKVYPIVAKALQFRITRNNDPTMENAPYPIGIKNVLIRRNVYDRAQGSQYFEDETDTLGNIVTKYIKDWDAVKADDDDPYTFWKSEPMPDPAAVACLYLNVCGDDGGPRIIDRVYLDPVYTGQMLNLYYSSDDTVGTRKLSPITITPSNDENTSWTQGSGRSDVSTGIETSDYAWTMAVGPQVQSDAWIGIEWTPDFDPGDGPPQNPILYRTVVPDSPTGIWYPSLSYDVGAGEFILEFDDGTDTRTYSAPMTTAFSPGNPLRIVAAWRYNPDTVAISVVDASGNVLASLLENPSTLPDQVSFDGTSELFAFRGLVTALIVKLENYLISSPTFQANPTYYVDPDPVIPDAQGNVPSTTLDDAIYAVSWVAQEHGCGGSDDTHYTDKEWTPIWRDYLCEKGMLFFPQALSMKYLKLEFTNLTEQPYPIYESGISVQYKVFPISVTQQSSIGPKLYTGTGGFLGMGSFISMNGVRSVNWLNPASIISAIGSVTGTQYAPVQITQGSGYVSATLPNDGVTNASTSRRTEAASSYVYRRDVLQPYILASDAINTTIKAEGLQQLASYTDVPWDAIEAANPGAITHVKSTGALPIRGTDWWVYPGQQLKVPANVMSKLTSTSTVVERKLTTESRVRFNTTQIHRYDIKTVTRDAAMAYFAGIREVTPYTSTFIDGEDKVYFDFPSYDATQFSLNHTKSVEAGPITTARPFYAIPNGLFERDLSNWTVDSNTAWSWDGTTGRWLRGTAKCTASGTPHFILSDRLSVTAGEALTHRVSLKYADLLSAELYPGSSLFPGPNIYPGGSLGIPDDDAPGIRWGVRYYTNDTELSTHYMNEVVYSDWATDPDLDWTDWTVNHTVPDGANWFRIVMEVEGVITSGSVWFENVAVATTDTTTATAIKALQTYSTFAKVACDFTDSGLVQSDSMWADILPDSQSIDDTKLAYYTTTIPDTLPGGTWGDTVKTWGGSDVEWGTPFSEIAITIDPDKIRDGRRVLHFRREAGAGESGIKVKQWTNYVPMGLFRIRASFYKPTANANSVTARLRRLSDGVIVYEENFPATAGKWVDWTSKFVEIPNSTDQEYEVYLTLAGDAADELYLADLYTEVALVRYFVKLGAGSGAFLHEVTDLRYINGTANVTVTTPVTDLLVQVAILSPKAWAFGCRLTPTYLK